MLDVFRAREHRYAVSIFFCFVGVQYMAYKGALAYIYIPSIPYFIRLANSESGGREVGLGRGLKQYRDRQYQEKIQNTVT